MRKCINPDKIFLNHHWTNHCHHWPALGQCQPNAVCCKRSMLWTFATFSYQCASGKYCCNSSWRYYIPEQSDMCTAHYSLLQLNCELPCSVLSYTILVSPWYVIRWYWFRDTFLYPEHYRGIAVSSHNHGFLLLYHKSEFQIENLHSQIFIEIFSWWYFTGNRIFVLWIIYDTLSQMIWCQRQMRPASQILYNAMKSAPMYSPCYVPSRELNSISLAPLLTELAYLAMLFILQLTNIAK